MTMPPELSFQHVHEPGKENDPAYALILLHGTGANQHDLLPLASQTAPHKPLLSPLGKVREQGRPRWFKRKRPGVFDEDDLVHRAQELADFLEEASNAYDLDPDHLVAMGFSNGANIATTLLLLHPNILRGAVLLRPMLPLEPETLPDLTNVPVYIAAGEHDELVPKESLQRLTEILQEAGADVTTRWASAGHGLTSDEVTRIEQWLRANEHRLGQPRAPQR